MKKTIIILVVIAVVGLGAYLVFGRKKTSNSANISTSSTASNTTPSSNSNDTQSQNTITYSDNGFSPATLTVKSGTTVTIKNTSSNSLQFDSDPHPDHTDNTELNVGLLSSGQSKTFTVTKTGTFGYHNHLSASDKGTIVVQ